MSREWECEVGRVTLCSKSGAITQSHASEVQRKVNKGKIKVGIKESKDIRYMFFLGGIAGRVVIGRHGMMMWLTILLLTISPPSHTMRHARLGIWEAIRFAVGPTAEVLTKRC